MTPQNKRKLAKAVMATGGFFTAPFTLVGIAGLLFLAPLGLVAMLSEKIHKCKYIKIENSNYEWDEQKGDFQVDVECEACGEKFTMWDDDYQELYGDKYD